MKTQSAKAKGRKLQQYVRDEILAYFPELGEDDVRSTSMGASGEDVLLSPKARAILPISVECKSLARISVYRYYEQAKANAKGHWPVVVIKENGEKPLAVIDVSFLLHLLKMAYES